MLAGGLCWTSHNILIGSIGGSLIELSFLFVNCHTMYRIVATTAVEPCLIPCPQVSLAAVKE